MTNRERQYKDSAQLTFYGFIGIIAVVIAIVMTGGSPKDNGEEVPVVEMADTNLILYNEPSKEDTDWTDTTQDEIYPEYKEYDRFIDVPAGSDSIVIVAGIMYTRNEDESQWIPIYLDEDVVWIGGNGDTIWE